MRIQRILYPSVTSPATGWALARRLLESTGRKSCPGHVIPAWPSYPVGGPTTIANTRPDVRRATDRLSLRLQDLLEPGQVSLHLFPHRPVHERLG
jgi:hypothetical protein